MYPRGLMKVNLPPQNCSTLCVQLFLPFTSSDILKQVFRRGVWLYEKLFHICPDKNPNLSCRMSCWSPELLSKSCSVVSCLPVNNLVLPAGSDVSPCCITMVTQQPFSGITFCFIVCNLRASLGILAAGWKWGGALPEWRSLGFLGCYHEISVSFCVWCLSVLCLSTLILFGERDNFFWGGGDPRV